MDGGLGARDCGSLVCWDREHTVAVWEGAGCAWDCVASSMCSELSGSLLRVIAVRSMLTPWTAQNLYVVPGTAWKNIVPLGLALKHWSPLRRGGERETIPTEQNKGPQIKKNKFTMPNLGVTLDTPFTLEH